MFRSRRRKTREVQTELNITAFMNLMVVLVPFLLITAVFSQVSVLQLNLPGGDGVVEEQTDDPLLMELEVTLRANRMVLSDRNSGVISTFKSILDESGSVTYDYKKLNQKLQEIKPRATDITTITVLNEDSTTFDAIVQTMDAVRLIPATEENDFTTSELFPDVGLGSAPPDPEKGDAK